MKKSTGWLFAGLGLLAALVIVLEPTGLIRGRLMGESFFANRPASYWRRALAAGPGERAAAREQLTHGGTASVDVLTSVLQTGATAEVRWTAAEMLAALGPDAESAHPVLLSALQDKDTHIQAVAAAAIPKVSTPADLAIPSLIPLLKREHAAIAARAISEYHGQAAPAIPALVELLNDTSQSTEARWNAARTLGKIGPPAVDIVPALIVATHDGEATIREHAVEAIGDIGPSAVDGIPALIDALDDPATRVRRDAVRSLSYMGAAAEQAVPQIKLLLDDPEEIVREAATNALRAIAPEELPEYPADAPADPEATPSTP